MKFCMNVMPFEPNKKENSRDESKIIKLMWKYASTIEELLERKSSGSGLDYGHRGSAALTYVTPLYPHKLALTSPTNGGRSVGRVRSRAQATDFVCLFVL
jgi:hypothetical protein